MIPPRNRKDPEEGSPRGILENDEIDGIVMAPEDRVSKPFLKAHVILAQRGSQPAEGFLKRMTIWLSPKGQWRHPC